MNAAKHIISEALSVLIQLLLFLASVQIGLKVQGPETALLFGAVIAALIIAYNDYQEKKHREQSTDESGRGAHGTTENENRQSTGSAG